MSKVQYGAIITEMRGSIGGISFQQNANAKIARIKFARHKKNTVKQNNQMTLFQEQLPLWASLDQLEKNLWNEFASLHKKEDHWGELRTLSGFQYFISINNNLALIGEFPILAPPIWETPLVVANYNAVAIFDDFSINWLTPFDHSAHYLLLFTSPLLRTVSLANRKILRLTAIISPDITSSFDYLEQWKLTHNMPVPIPGNPSKKMIFVALMTIHYEKGLASAFNTNYAEYEPT